MAVCPACSVLTLCFTFSGAALPGRWARTVRAVRPVCRRSQPNEDLCGARSFARGAVWHKPPVVMDRADAGASRSPQVKRPAPTVAAAGGDVIDVASNDEGTQPARKLRRLSGPPSVSNPRHTPKPSPRTDNVGDGGSGCAVSSGSSPTCASGAGAGADSGAGAGAGGCEAGAAAGGQWSPTATGDVGSGTTAPVAAGKLVDVDGDLLAAREQYIVQQCNCTTHRSLGLSAAVFMRFPHSDVYQYPGKRQAGTISVHGGKLGQRGVINMMAQVNPGR